MHQLMYHIGYMNANSLCDRKFAQTIRLLETSFEFLFITEHWNQHHQSRLSHPLVHCSTTLPPRPPNSLLRGRHHGGIYLLVKPHLRSIIQHTTLSTYSITVSVPGFRFAGVYYPPFSMSEQTLQTNFNQIGPLDLLLGDINTKFQHNTSLSRRGPAPNLSSRAGLFQTWAVNTNMVHIQDPSEYATSHTIPDHVFAALQHQPNIALSLVSTQSLSFQTDHRFLLHVKFDHPASSSRPPAPQVPAASTTQTGPTRFHVQRLRKEPIAKKYRQNWESMQTLFTSFKGSERFDVNMLDSIICSAVQAIAESTLGVYKPQESRQKEDKAAKQLSAKLDMSASIQLLKRAQRASVVGQHMVSSTGQSTLMEECIEHYSKMFNSSASSSIPSAGPSRYTLNNLGFSPPDPPSLPSFSSRIPALQCSEPFPESTLLASRLLAHISIDKIKVQLGHMCSTASCGTDGITVIMLRHLLETSFPKHLHQLYLACLRTGQTPRRWNESIVYPLCKDRKEPYTAQNSRPLSLVCLFRKLFEALILPIVSTSGKMPYSGAQAGFRSGYSTLTNVLTLHHQIEADAGLHIVFLDFAAGFDKVAWSYLERELKAQDIYPLVLRLIHQLMFQDMSFSLLVNGCPSAQQNRNCGLLQGSPLSPIFFNRFINSLLQSLN